MGILVWLVGSIVGASSATGCWPGPEPHSGRPDARSSERWRRSSCTGPPPDGARTRSVGPVPLGGPAISSRLEPRSGGGVRRRDGAHHRPYLVEQLADRWGVDTDRGPGSGSRSTVGTDSPRFRSFPPRVYIGEMGRPTSVQPRDGDHRLQGGEPPSDRGRGPPGADRRRLGGGQQIGMKIEESRKRGRPPCLICWWSHKGARRHEVLARVPGADDRSKIAAVESLGIEFPPGYDICDCRERAYGLLAMEEEARTRGWHPVMVDGVYVVAADGPAHRLANRDVA